MTPAPVTVPLSTPIKASGQVVEALVVSRLANGEDLLAIEGMGNTGKTLTLIQRLYRTTDGAEISLQAVKSLSWPDITALGSALDPFLEGGPATSGPSTAA